MSPWRLGIWSKSPGFTLGVSNLRFLILKSSLSLMTWQDGMLRSWMICSCTSGVRQQILFLVPAGLLASPPSGSESVSPGVPLSAECSSVTAGCRREWSTAQPLR